jgi:hypothetical protein
MFGKVDRAHTQLEAYLLLQRYGLLNEVEKITEVRNRGFVGRTSPQLYLNKIFAQYQGGMSFTK